MVDKHFLALPAIFLQLRICPWWDMAPTVDTLLSASPPSMAQACPRGKMVIPNKTKAESHQRLKVSSETAGLGWQLITTALLQFAGEIAATSNKKVDRHLFISFLKTIYLNLQNIQSKCMISQDLEATHIPSRNLTMDFFNSQQRWVSPNFHLLGAPMTNLAEWKCIKICDRFMSHPSNVYPPGAAHESIVLIHVVSITSQVASLHESGSKTGNNQHHQPLDYQR